MGIKLVTFRSGHIFEEMTHADGTTIMARFYHPRAMAGTAVWHDGQDEYRSLVSDQLHGSSMEMVQLSMSNDGEFNDVRTAAFWECGSFSVMQRLIAAIQTELQGDPDDEQHQWLEELQRDATVYMVEHFVQSRTQGGGS